MTTERYQIRAYFAIDRNRYRNRAHDLLLCQLCQIQTNCYYYIHGVIPDPGYLGQAPLPIARARCSHPGAGPSHRHHPFSPAVLADLHHLRLLLRHHLPFRLPRPGVLHEEVSDVLSQRQLHQRTHLLDLRLCLSHLWLHH